MSQAQQIVDYLGVLEVIGRHLQEEHQVKRGAEMVPMLPWAPGRHHGHIVIMMMMIIIITWTSMITIILMGTIEGNFKNEVVCPGV